MTSLEHKSARTRSGGKKPSVGVRYHNSVEKLGACAMESWRRVHPTLSCGQTVRSSPARMIDSDAAHLTRRVKGKRSKEESGRGQADLAVHTHTHLIVSPCLSMLDRGRACSPAYFPHFWSQFHSGSLAMYPHGRAPSSAKIML